MTLWQTTLGAKLQDLRRFLTVYESYTTSLQSKIDHLERTEARVVEDIAVYTRFLGHNVGAKNVAIMVFVMWKGNLSMDE